VNGIWALLTEDDRPMMYGGLLAIQRRPVRSLIADSRFQPEHRRVFLTVKGCSPLYIDAL
jgi:hypothetical protein